MRASHKETIQEGGGLKHKQLHTDSFCSRDFLLVFLSYIFCGAGAADTPFRSHDVQCMPRGGGGGNRAEIHPIQIHKFKG